MGNSPSRQSPSRDSLGFGVEIELSAVPRKTNVSPANVWDYRRAGFQNLRCAMQDRDIKTTMDPVNSNGTFTKYPANYQRWHLTQDNSVAARADSNTIPLEAVSRVFHVSQKKWIEEVERFWYAVDHVFKKKIRNLSCGCHVHVRPLHQGYTMHQLRTIAYTTIIYEKHILEILPKERRNQYYCQPNTHSSPSLKQIFSNGRSRESFDALRKKIYSIDTREGLCELMQGHDLNNRYVLWNFDNIKNGMSGTIEFRGGPGVRSGYKTICWILFAISFILFALNEDELKRGDFSHVSPRGANFRRKVEAFWRKVRQCGIKKVQQERRLPKAYRQMHYY